MIKRNEPIKSQNAEQLRQEVAELENQLKEMDKQISELRDMYVYGLIIRHCMAPQISHFVIWGVHEN